MSKICEDCGKKPSTGNTVSYSNRKSRRRFLPNLMLKRIWNAGEKMFEKRRICTRCVRNLAKKI